MTKLIQMLYVIHRENMTILNIMSQIMLNKNGKEKIKSIVDGYEKTIRDIDNEEE